MTQKEKAQAYDEAIKYAHYLINERCKEGTNGSFHRADLDKMFPKLAENEDERIADEIIQFLYLPHPQFVGKRDHEEWIAWLEKQGKQEEHQVYETKDGEIITYSETDGYKVIEPKFKVGDWVINIITKEVEQVIELTNSEYICSGHLVVSFNNQHLLKRWSIDDAKDGDVLAIGDVIFIYKRTLASHIVSYCKLINDDFESTLDARTCCEGNAYIHPTTKEQRDLLFQKMKEAGYEWDAKKKKLKKISQRMVSAEAKEAMYSKPTWSEEVITTISRAISIVKWAAYSDHSHPILNDKGATELIERLNSLKERVQPQNGYNPYKEVVESITEMCKHYDKASHSSLRDFYDNVKVKCKDAKEYDSLYPQTTWKPSDRKANELLDTRE